MLNILHCHTATPPDHCKGSPCKHEGTCDNLIDGFFCHCTSSFTGKTCNTRKHNYNGKFYITCVTILEQLIIAWAFAIVAVRIEIKPRITTQPQNITGVLFSTVTLRCTAEGYPQPEYHWYKDSNRLATTSNILVIDELRPRDRGFYCCQAENSAGTAKSDIALINIEGLCMQYTKWAVQCWIRSCVQWCHFVDNFWRCCSVWSSDRAKRSYARNRNAFGTGKYLHSNYSYICRLSLMISKYFFRSIIFWLAADLQSMHPFFSFNLCLLASELEIIISCLKFLKFWISSVTAEVVPIIITLITDDGGSEKLRQEVLVEMERVELLLSHQISINVTTVDRFGQPLNQLLTTLIIPLW